MNTLSNFVTYSQLTQRYNFSAKVTARRRGNKEATLLPTRKVLRSNYVYGLWKRVRKRIVRCVDVSTQQFHLSSHRYNASACIRCLKNRLLKILQETTQMSYNCELEYMILLRKKIYAESNIFSLLDLRVSPRARKQLAKAFQSASYIRIVMHILPLMGVGV